MKKENYKRATEIQDDINRIESYLYFLNPWFANCRWFGIKKVHIPMRLFATLGDTRKEIVLDQDVKQDITNALNKKLDALKAEFDTL